MKGAGLCHKFPEERGAASEAGACEECGRGRVAELEGTLRGRARPCRACWSSEHLGVLCSWCSLGGRERERADILPLWRMSAFCLTGPGEGPRVPVEFSWHPRDPTPDPSKLEKKARTPPSVRASSCLPAGFRLSASQNCFWSCGWGLARTRGWRVPRPHCRRVLLGSTVSGRPSDKVKGW